MCSNVMKSENIFRTEDVDTKENSTFESLLLSKRLLKGLQENGLYKLSPVQLKAIPIGKCGFDLVVQAKSGTGKTCVFSIIILENLSVKINHLQALILAPTREIAYQIMGVLTSIGSYIPNLSCHSFIGGLSVSRDKIKLKNCQIAVGTPGRIKQLLKLGVMHSESIRFFVLDEADKLMEESFRKDVLAETVCKELIKNNWSATYLTAAQQQHIRLQALENLKAYNCRILVSTDVSARGIDIMNVNLVINFDIPWDTATYVHRIGRGGRFGTISQAVSIAVEGEEYDRLCNIISESNSKLSPIDLNKICDRDASDFTSSKSKNLEYLKTLLFLEKDKKLQITLTEIVCRNPAKQLPSFSEIKEQFNNFNKGDCSSNLAIKQAENVQETVEQIHNYLESKKQNFKEAYNLVNSAYKPDSQQDTNLDTFELQKLYNGKTKNNKSCRIKYKSQYDKYHSFKSNKSLLANNVARKNLELYKKCVDNNEYKHEIGNNLLDSKIHAVTENSIDFSVVSSSDNENDGSILSSSDNENDSSVLSSSDNENEYALKINSRKKNNQSENVHSWIQWYNNLNWSLYIMKVFVWHKEYFRYMLNTRM